MPRVFSETPLDFSIELKIDMDTTTLLFEFEIFMVPSEPVAWKILTTENVAEGAPLCFMR